MLGSPFTPGLLSERFLFFADLCPLTVGSPGPGESSFLTFVSPTLEGVWTIPFPSPMTFPSLSPVLDLLVLPGPRAAPVLVA